MVWNFIIHIVIGLLGSEIFTWTVKGVLMSLLIVCVTQPSEMARIYMEGKRKIEKGPAGKQKAELEAFNKQFKKELPATLIQNIIMYTAIVLLAAEIIRSSGYSI